MCVCVCVSFSSVRKNYRYEWHYIDDTDDRLSSMNRHQTYLEYIQYLHVSNLLEGLLKFHFEMNTHSHEHKHINTHVRRVNTHIFGIYEAVRCRKFDSLASKQFQTHFGFQHCCCCRCARSCQNESKFARWSDSGIFLLTATVFDLRSENFMHYLCQVFYCLWIGASGDVSVVCMHFVYMSKCLPNRCRFGKFSHSPMLCNREYPLNRQRTSKKMICRLRYMVNA